MTIAVFVFYLLVMCVWALFGAMGWHVGEARNAQASGLLAGLLLGPFGVIAAAGLDQRPHCPRCQGRLDGEGQVCQHCGVALRWPGPAMGEVAAAGLARRAVPPVR